MPFVATLLYIYVAAIYLTSTLNSIGYTIDRFTITKFSFVYDTIAY